jgi:hypothetical protein
MYFCGVSTEALIDKQRLGGRMHNVTEHIVITDDGAYEARGASGIDDLRLVLAEAVGLSQELSGESVSFCYDGRTIIIDPSTNTDEVIAKYNSGDHVIDEHDPQFYNHLLQRICP